MQPYAVQTPLGWTIIGSRLHSNSSFPVQASSKTFNPVATSTSKGFNSEALKNVTSSNVVLSNKCSSLLVTCSILSSSTSVFQQHPTSKAVFSNHRRVRRYKFDSSSSIQTVKKLFGKHARKVVARFAHRTVIGPKFPCHIR